MDLGGNRVFVLRPDSQCAPIDSVLRIEIRALLTLTIGVVSFLVGITPSHTTFSLAVGSLFFVATVIGSAVVSYIRYANLKSRFPVPVSRSLIV